MSFTKSVLSALVLSVAIAGIEVNAGEPWAPVEGFSSVDQQKTYNEFRFFTAEDQFTEEQTYEHETQVYNPLFADYAGT